MRPFITNNPSRINKPMNYQAFRPGEWSLPKKSNIYIFNNYNNQSYGYRGWGDAWAAPDYGYKPTFWDKFGDAIEAIGLGLGVAGNAIGLFKK